MYEEADAKVEYDTYDCSGNCRECGADAGKGAEFFDVRRS